MYIYKYTIYTIYPNQPTKYTAQLVGWFFFGSFLILKGAFLNFLDDGGQTGGPEAAQLGGSGTRWRRNAGADRGVQDDFSPHSFAYQWAVSDIVILGSAALLTMYLSFLCHGRLIRFNTSRPYILVPLRLSQSIFKPGLSHGAFRK